MRLPLSLSNSDSAMQDTHLSEELAQSTEAVRVNTRHGIVSGRRASNGAVVFLEVPYALPPTRFCDAEALPDGYEYKDMEYIHESAYAVQPGNDGQAAGIPRHHHLGLGQPSENPLFVNIVVPPTFDAQAEPSAEFPVRIYIHGGFLQFGSPHSLNSQAQYVAAERNEIWINVGYRLSAFGFLACDEPRVDGNFGFKDQWLALEWVQNNIEAFGGDTNDIQVTGLSAGAHSVHQILHHASRLPPGKKAPFQSAMLQSNAMLSSPKTPGELRVQFEALCTALSLDPGSPDVLDTLRDPSKVPWEAITSAIEEDRLGPYGTFRGCLDGNWIATDPDPMTWQRTGELAKGLLAAGVRYVIIGDLSEEWYLYSIAHPFSTPADVRTNLLRYYPSAVVDDLLSVYPNLDDNASAEACAKYFGQISSDGQVHLPVRLFARDMANGGLPVLRYHIKWTPEQVRELTKGYVTHATDRVLWCFREPILTTEQRSIAREWLREVNTISRTLGESRTNLLDTKKVIVLNDDRKISAQEDTRWDDMMRVAKILPGEA